MLVLPLLHVVNDSWQRRRPHGAHVGCRSRSGRLKALAQRALVVLGVREEAGPVLGSQKGVLVSLVEAIVLAGRRLLEPVSRSGVSASLPRRLQLLFLTRPQPRRSGLGRLMQLLPTCTRSVSARHASSWSSNTSDLRSMRVMQLNKYNWDVVSRYILCNS